MSCEEIEQFLYREVALIDDRLFDEWLALFADDAVYWVPNASRDGDPSREGSLIYEDRRGIADRVRRLQHPAALTQAPPPRTCHFISNVMVRNGDHDEVVVRSNQIVYATRQGREVQYPGVWEHVLRQTGGDWRIQRKKVYLLSNDQPMSQLPLL